MASDTVVQRLTEAQGTLVLPEVLLDEVKRLFTMRQLLMMLLDVLAASKALTSFHEVRQCRNERD